MKNIIYTIIVITIFTTANLSSAEGSAYVAPSSESEIGITSIIDFDTNNYFAYNANPSCLYGHSWNKDLSGSVRSKGRITIRQYPIDSANNYPVMITVGSPNSMDVTGLHSETGQFKGPKGFDCIPVYLWPFISQSRIKMDYQGNSTTPSNYLIYSYPETQNKNTTKTYSHSETISVGGKISWNVSHDLGKSGAGGEINASYAVANVTGGTVSSRQMEVDRTNYGAQGNRWQYTLKTDNNGRDLTHLYAIMDNGIDTGNLKSAVPNIACSFTPELGQLWKIPKGVSQVFGVNIELDATATWAVKSWAWGIGNIEGKWSATDTGYIYNDTLNLDTTHPAISGLNTLRFRFGNTGQCMVPEYRFNLPTLMKMQDCSTAVSAQYFIQNSDYSLANAGTGAWYQLGFGPIIRVRNGNIECASYDGKNCISENNSIEELKEYNLYPLICGDMHRQIWGEDGYSRSDHWCAKSRNILQPNLKEERLVTTSPEILYTSNWFKDETIAHLSKAPIRIIDGNFACYAPDGRNCAQNDLSKLADNDIVYEKLLICGSDHMQKYGITGYDDSNHWCAQLSAKYLPVSIAGESGDLYNKFYFQDDGTMRTIIRDYKVDYSTGNRPIVRDLTMGTRNGLWKYLLF